MSSKTIKVKHALSQTGKKLRADEVARLVHVAGVLGQHLDLALRRVEVHVRLLELSLRGGLQLRPAAAAHAARGAVPDDMGQVTMF